MLFTQKRQFFSNRGAYIFSAGLLPLLIVVAVAFFQHMDIVLAQLSIVSARKRMELPDFFLVLLHGNIVHKLRYILYFVVTCVYVYHAWSTRSKNGIFISIIAISAWAFSIFGQMTAYALYPFAFVPLMIGTGIVDAKKILKNFFYASCICFLLLNMLIYLIKISTSGWNFNYYQDFSAQVLEVIPDKKSVFLISIPDPYFAFKKSSRANVLYQYPYMPTTYSSYIKQLNASDYIVFTASYDGIVFGNFLTQYIIANNETVTEIPVLNHVAYIIRLKPIHDRVIPEEYVGIIEKENRDETLR